MSHTVTSIPHKIQTPWLVQFDEFRTATEEDQRRILDNIDLDMMGRIVDIWLDVVVPEARVIEPHECATKIIAFSRRDDQRKFLRTFGDRKLAKLPAGLPI